jgi:hypothetical protein
LAIAAVEAYFVNISSIGYREEAQMRLASAVLPLVGDLFDSMLSAAPPKPGGLDTA